jgi:hypothetical protein
MHVVSISGVFGWRGRNNAGGRATLPDWDDVAFDGRDVSLIFDSDLRTNPRSAKFEPAPQHARATRGSRPHRLSAAGPNGEKVGLDDYFANGGTVEGLAAPTTAASNPDP